MNRYIALQKIVELGSFSKAADALGYTQSAVSQLISSLEEDLKIKLINRSRLGAKLTAEGEELYPFIEKAIFNYNAINEKANEIRGLETGIIRIGCVSSVSTHWMPNLIKRFKEIYPKVNFSLMQGDYAQIREWIKADAVDFGFINPKSAPGFKMKLVKSIPLMAVVPTFHPLAENDVINLSELLEEPFIMLEYGDYNEQTEFFKSHNLTPNVKYKIHDDYAIMSMVEAGLGVSIIAGLILHRTSYDIAIKHTDPSITRDIAMVWKDENMIPMASRRFMQFVEENADLLPG